MGVSLGISDVQDYAASWPLLDLVRSTLGHQILSQILPHLVISALVELYVGCRIKR